MAVSSEKKAIGLVLGLLGAFALVAAFSPQAWATDVTPSDTQFTINSVTSTDFMPENAYASEGVKCQVDANGNPASTAQFTVEDDSDRNVNQGSNTGGPIGTNSGQHEPTANGDGSVIAHMDQNANGDRAPVFNNCNVWDYSTASAITGATVTTNDDNGAWSIAAHASNDRGAMLAIGVPAQGAEIAFTGCTITVSDHPTVGGVASAVKAEYWNPGVKDGFSNGMADVDGQLDFTKSGLGCVDFGPTPVQFEAIYEPTTAMTVA